MKISQASAATIAVIRAFIGLDANDNLFAHVSPRVDILANLLQVFDAGDGEIATASDVDAHVVYKGSPSVGVVYSRSELIALFSFTDSSLVLPGSGADIQIEIDPASLTDDGGYLNDIDNTFISGQLVHDTASAKSYVLDLSVEVNSLIPAGGAYVKLVLEQFIFSWQEVATYILPVVPVAGVLPVYPFNNSITLPVSTAPFRLMLSTDYVGLMPTNVVVKGKYSNYAGTGYTPIKA